MLFFFSSRRRHTRYWRDWSSDVCSSDLDELNRRHPDMNIQIEYNDFPYNITRNQILDRLSSGESVDIISVDQIWLGEFAGNDLLRNLTSEFEQWGRMGDLYEGNLDGCVYNNTIYA